MQTMKRILDFSVSIRMLVDISDFFLIHQPDHVLNNVTTSNAQITYHWFKHTLPQAEKRDRKARIGIPSDENARSSPAHAVRIDVRRGAGEGRG